MTSASIARIKDLLPLPDLAGEYATLRKSGTESLMVCWWHKDSEPSCRVYQDHYFCFTCQAHGDVVDFYAKAESLSKGAAIRALALRTGVSLEGRPPTRRQKVYDREAREFAQQWRKQRAADLGLRLTLTIEGGASDEACEREGLRVQEVRSLKGDALRMAALTASQQERNLWKTWKAECEEVAWWVVAALRVRCSSLDPIARLG